MTFQVKAEILLNNSNWERNLKKSSKQIEGFGKSAKTIANGIKAAWAGVALLAFGAVGDAIMDVTKAAAEERKSIGLLNGALDKNWHATDKTKQAVADFITKQQNLSGIVDDKLRPAFAKLALVIKKPEKAMKAFSLAMDVSAGTGKDLGTVSQAMAKFFGGNKSALDKLVPGLKDAGDKMAFLQSKYGGMAAVAGSNDPFARINVVMEDFKEKLGTAFLPVIDKFAEWLTSDEAQTALDDIAKKVQAFGDWFMSPEGQKTFDSWMDDLKSLMTLVGDFLDLVGEVRALLDTKTNQKAVLSTKSGRDALNPFKGGLGYSTMNQQLMSGTGPMMSAVDNKPPVINIKVNPITGDAVAEMLKGTAKRKGITVGRMIQG
jgi:hypothetical protein